MIFSQHQLVIEDDGNRIGQIEASPGLRLLDSAGQAVVNCYKSFDHFA